MAGGGEKKIESQRLYLELRFDLGAADHTGFVIQFESCKSHKFCYLIWDLRFDLGNELRLRSFSHTGFVILFENWSGRQLMTNVVAVGVGWRSSLLV